MGYITGSGFHGVFLDFWDWNAAIPEEASFQVMDVSEFDPDTGTWISNQLIQDHSLKSQYVSTIFLGHV